MSMKSAAAGKSSARSRRGRRAANGRPQKPGPRPFPGYTTKLGRYSVATIETWLDSSQGRRWEQKVNLILTSPPFPLNHKKSYGNLTGQQYIKWLRLLAPRFAALLKKNGSLVIEIGNAWNPDLPTMSTLPMEALFAIKDAGEFHLCQEFICHNPARLPSPAQHVTIDRVRVKDSWTRIWWLSKIARPKAHNRRILLPYSKAMQSLLKSQRYNPGLRPSQHVVSSRGFLQDNGGAIPASCLTSSVLDHFGSLVVTGNTASSDPYLRWCRKNGVAAHPARMPPGLARFFVSFLTTPGDVVLDPFAGSNTTGYVAEQLRRRWLAIEANQENSKPSRTRFALE